jgi:hypothetical protein
VVFLQDFGEARTGKLCSLVGIENLKDTDGQGSGQRTDAEELLRDVPGKQSKNCLYEKEDDFGNVASWNNIVASSPIPMSVSTPTSRYWELSPTAGST